MKWENISENKPNKGEYILIETIYCKYPCVVGFWNGIDFISSDDKTVVVNAKYWSRMIPRLHVGQELKAVNEGKMYHDEEHSLIKGKIYKILNIDNNDLDGVYVEINSEVSDNHCFSVHNLYQYFEILNIKKQY